jgi:hypothetical protein
MLIQLSLLYNTSTVQLFSRSNRQLWEFANSLELVAFDAYASNISAAHHYCLQHKHHTAASLS